VLPPPPDLTIQARNWLCHAAEKPPAAFLLLAPARPRSDVCSDVETVTGSCTDDNPANSLEPSGANRACDCPRYARQTTAEGQLVNDIGPNSPGESQLTSKGLTTSAVYYQDIRALRMAAEVLVGFR
jgi:hypothetical protein